MLIVIRSKAERYREEAVKCHELVKAASPAYLDDFYRRIAVRYLFIAEDVSRWPEQRGDAVSSRNAQISLAVLGSC
jgi:hypothetical protein